MNSFALSQRERQIALVLAGVISIALVYRLGVFPLKDRFEQIQIKIMARQREIDRNLRVVQRAKIYEQQYGSLLENFRQKGSDEQVMSGLIRDIESLSPDIRMTDIKPQKVRKEEFSNHFSVSLTFEGSLASLMDFIYRLQSPAYSFSVDELRLDKKAPNSTELKGSLVLSRVLIQP
jgi:hypothetical protein